MSERLLCRVAHARILLHHVTDKILCCRSKVRCFRKCEQEQCSVDAAHCVITRFRYVIPEGRVKLILGLHDFGKQSCLGLFIKGGISTESAGKIWMFVILGGNFNPKLFYSVLHLSWQTLEGATTQPLQHLSLCDMMHEQQQTIIWKSIP